MEYKIGFIGCGNMGFALAKAAAKKEKSIILSAKDIEEAKEKAEILGCAYGTAKEVCKKSKYIFLGVKPQMLSDVASELSEEIKANEEAVLISMLAGVKIEKIKAFFGDKKVIRIMPNTPVSVGEGVILVCESENVTSKEKEEFISFMEKAGTIDSLPEELIDAGCAVSGCGPAFCYMFAKGMAQGGINAGLSKEKAIKYALLTLKGASSLALSKEKELDTLIDEVCSPGGSTIEGVKSLNEDGFYTVVETALKKSFEKTKKLGE